MLFQCQKCGWCCTHFGLPLKVRTGYLWYNFTLGKHFPAILSFEKKVLRVLAAKKKKKVDFPIGEFWVDDSRKRVIVLDYAFSKEICGFYDDLHSKCTIYDSRPTVCRMFPITSLNAIGVPEVKIAVDVFNCSSAISIFGRGKDKHEEVVCPSGHTFSSIFGLQLQDAAMIDFYMSRASVYIGRLGKLEMVRLKPFRPNRASRVLAKYEIVEFEDLFRQLEGESFRSLLKPLFLEKVQKNNIEAVELGVPTVDVETVASWIEKHW